MRKRQLFIRQYQPSDKQAVFDLHVWTLKHDDTYMYTGKWEYDFDNIEGVYLNSQGTFLVGLLDNNIIAIGGLRKMTDMIGEIRRMRIDPAFQRKGYGQEIFDALEKKAIELGYKVLQLNTSAKQISAQQFYIKNGFKEIRRETEGWIVDNIIYQKRLQ